MFRDVSEIVTHSDPFFDRDVPISLMGKAAGFVEYLDPRDDRLLVEPPRFRYLECFLHEGICSPEVEMGGRSRGLSNLWGHSQNRPIVKCGVVRTRSAPRTGQLIVVRPRRVNHERFILTFRERRERREIQHVERIRILRQVVRTYVYTSSSISRAENLVLILSQRPLRTVGESNLCDFAREFSRNVRIKGRRERRRIHKQINLLSATPESVV